VSSSTTNFNNTRVFTVGHGLIEYYNGVSVVQTGGVDRILYYNSGVQQPTITTVTAPVLHDANSYTRISGHHQVCDTTDFDNTFTGTKAFFDMLTTPITTDEDEQYVIGVIEAYNIRCQYLAQIDTSIPSNNCWQIRYVFRGVTGETFVSFQRGSTSQLFNAGIDTAPFNYKKYALPDSVVLAETYRIQEIQEDETTITRFQFYSAGRVFELDIHCNVGISTTDYTPPVIGDSLLSDPPARFLGPILVDKTCVTGVADVQAGATTLPSITDGGMDSYNETVNETTIASRFRQVSLEPTLTAESATHYNHFVVGKYISRFKFAPMNGRVKNETDGIVVIRNPSDNRTCIAYKTITCSTSTIAGAVLYPKTNAMTTIFDDLTVTYVSKELIHFSLDGAFYALAVGSSRMIAGVKYIATYDSTVGSLGTVNFVAVDNGISTAIGAYTLTSAPEVDTEITIVVFFGDMIDENTTHAFGPEEDLIRMVTGVRQITVEGETVLEGELGSKAYLPGISEEDRARLLEGGVEEIEHTGWFHRVSYRSTPLVLSRVIVLGVRLLRHAQGALKVSVDLPDDGLVTGGMINVADLPVTIGHIRLIGVVDESITGAPRTYTVGPNGDFVDFAAADAALKINKRQRRNVTAHLDFAAVGTKTVIVNATGGSMEIEGPNNTNSIVVFP
jgi:hypothetical protein